MHYVWTKIPSVEALGEMRLSAMEKFLADFEVVKAVDRYIPGELPSLPFDADAFDLALSSHFLFLYSEHLTLGSNEMLPNCVSQAGVINLS